MEYFWPQNQHFLIIFKILLLDFFKMYLMTGIKK